MPLMELFSGNCQGRTGFWKKPGAVLRGLELPFTQLECDSVQPAPSSSDLAISKSKAIVQKKNSCRSFLRPRPAGTARPRGCTEGWVGITRVVNNSRIIANCLQFVFF